MTNKGAIQVYRRAAEKIAAIKVDLEQAERRASDSDDQNGVQLEAELVEAYLDDAAEQLDTLIGQMEAADET